MSVALDRDISIMAPAGLSRFADCWLSPCVSPEGRCCLLIWACALLQEPCQTDMSIDALASRPPDRDARWVDGVLGWAALLRCAWLRVGLDGVVLSALQGARPSQRKSEVSPMRDPLRSLQLAVPVGGSPSERGARIRPDGGGPHRSACRDAG